jgi:diacylglycerol kinase (ATP)
MRITIIHNPTAGEADLSAKILCAELRAAGHEPVHVCTKHDDWKAALQDPGDAVLAAGGDGTVAKVARRLVGRGIPLAVLPLGTANNIAAALGSGDDWRALIHGLAGAEPRACDIGVAEGPWGERLFLEGVCFGLFPEMLVTIGDGSPEVASVFGARVELLRDLGRLRDQLAVTKPTRCSIEAEARTVEADALLLAVMNFPSLGPRVRLAPGAQIDDGLLHVVLAGEHHRAELDRYLHRRCEGQEVELRLDRLTARRLRIRWAAPFANVDDKLWKGTKRGIVADLSVKPGALHVLVPTLADDARPRR